MTGFTGLPCNGDTSCLSPAPAVQATETVPSMWPTAFPATALRPDASGQCRLQPSQPRVRCGTIDVDETGALLIRAPYTRVLSHLLLSDRRLVSSLSSLAPPTRGLHCPLNLWSRANFPVPMPLPSSTVVEPGASGTSQTEHRLGGLLLGNLSRKRENWETDTHTDH